MLVFGFTFWPLFDQVLDHLWISLGVFWEPSRASGGSLGKPLDPKTIKNLGFFKLFENAAFWLFELLMALLGSSCPLFGRSGPKMGPKIVPKNAPKKKPRLSLFFVLIFSKSFKASILNHLKASFETQNGPAFLHKILKEWAKMSPRSHQVLQRAFPKTLKNLEFLHVFGSRGIPRKPQGQNVQKRQVNYTPKKGVNIRGAW